MTFGLLYQKLFCVQHCWYSIGLGLGLLPSSLAAIEHKHGRDCERCIAELCEKWMNLKPSANWEDIVEVLENRSVNQRALASEIRNEFIGVQ